MADYVADPDGVIMKAGMVLSISYSQQDSREHFPSIICLPYHENAPGIDQRSINKESAAKSLSEQQESSHDGVVLPAIEQQPNSYESSTPIMSIEQSSIDPRYSECLRVIDQQATDFRNKEIENVSENNIGNLEIIKMINDINGGDSTRDITVSNCNVTHNTPENATLMESLSNQDTLNDRDVATVSIDHKASPIAETNKEVSSDVTEPTVITWDENCHKMFTKILEETRAKAEKEATRRAVEAVSSGQKDAACFEEIVSASLMDYVMLYQKACELSLHFEQEKSNFYLTKQISKKTLKDAIEETAAASEKQLLHSPISASSNKASNCALKTEFEYELPEEEEEEDPTVNGNSNHDSKDDSNATLNRKFSPDVTYDQMVSMNKQQSGYPALSVERNSFASLGYEMMGNLSSDYNYPLGKMGNLSSDWYSVQGTSDWSAKDNSVDRSYGYVPSVSTNYASPYQSELGDWRPGEDPFQRKSVPQSSQAADDSAMKSDGSRKRVVPIINTKSKKFSPPTMK